MNSLGHPLVSVVVVVYNAERYIIETLESVKVQSYKNIELVISDDASKDNSVEIIENWVEKNSNRFIKVNVLKSESNKGIAKNCNRGIINSSGEWIKMLSGDDMLTENSIEKYIQFVNRRKEYKIIFSDISIFHNNKYTVYNTPNELLEAKTIKKQTKALLKNLKPSSLSIFFSRKFIENYGGYDEKYNMYDDYPMLLKASFNKERFGFLDNISAIYRIHSESVLGSQFEGVEVNSFVKKDRINFYFEVVFKKQLRHILIKQFAKDYLRITNDIEKKSLKILFGRVLSKIILQIYFS